MLSADISPEVVGILMPYSFCEGAFWTEHAGRIQDEYFPIGDRDGWFSASPRLTPTNFSFLAIYYRVP
jgi:hypothetical protein